MSYTIGFIGAGNMAKAMLVGLLSQDEWSEDSFIMSAKSRATCESINGELGVECVTDNETVIRRADVLILAVKPQVLPEIVKAHKTLIAQSAKMVVSVAAGVSLDSLLGVFTGNDGSSVFRAMPNTPCLVRQGVTGLLADHGAKEADRVLVQGLFESMGSVVWVDSDEKMDAVTALSGSGPAFQFYLWEMLIESAQGYGLTEEQANQLVMATVQGTLALAQTNEAGLADLRAQVTSPNGTTAAGIEAMDRLGMASAMKEVIEAARARGQALSYQAAQLLKLG